MNCSNYANLNEVNTSLMNNQNMNIPNFLIFSSDNDTSNTFNKLSNTIKNNNSVDIIKQKFLSKNNIDNINKQFVTYLNQKLNINIRLQNVNYIIYKANVIFTDYYNYLYTDINKQLDRLNNILLEVLLKEGISNYYQKKKYQEDIKEDKIYNGLDISIPENISSAGTINLNTQDRVFNLYN